MDRDEISKLMEGLARDLVRLEQMRDLDPEWVRQIEQAYEQIYQDLLEIKRM